MSRLALIVALAACALGVVSLTRSQPTPGDNPVGAAKAYIQGIAKQNSLKIDGMKVVAVREHGNVAIVEVEVRYHPYLQITPTQTVKGPEATVTLSVRETRTSWRAEYGVAQ